MLIELKIGLIGVVFWQLAAVFYSSDGSGDDGEIKRRAINDPRGGWHDLSCRKNLLANQSPNDSLTDTKTFGLLVAVNYLGLTATNALNFNDFPEGSRAAQMAVSRMVREVLFASVYIWYY